MRFKDMREVDEYLEKEIASEKRFELEYDKNCYKCIFDNITKEYSSSRESIVALLNQLNDENEKLEKGKMEALSLLGEEIDKNEQLRQQVQILKKEVRDFLHLCDVCDIQSHLSDECEEVLNDE